MCYKGFLKPDSSDESWLSGGVIDNAQPYTLNPNPTEKSEIPGLVYLHCLFSHRSVKSYSSG